MSLLTDKYKPVKIEDMVGNSTNIQKAKIWLENFKEEIPGTPRALFIAGSPGIGKTTLANLLLQHYEYSVVEFNASDIRNQKLVREKFKNIMGKVTISSMMGGSKFMGIIMDEVDGMSSGDKGGIGELISMINPNKGKRKKDQKTYPYQNPIICICNDEKEKKIQELKKVCECLRFLPPKFTEIYNYAKKIIKLEKIKIEEDTLLEFVKFSQKDIRKLLGNLEFMILKKTNKNKKKIKAPELINSGLEKKQEDMELFSSVYTILNEYPGFEKTLQVCQTDRNLINLLVHENILKIMANYENSEDIKLQIMEKIYQCMSESDIMESYLYNNFTLEISEVNSLIRCGAISLLINEQKRNKNISFDMKDVVFSKLLSKFSIQHQNYKCHMNLHHKLQLTNYFKNNYDLYNVIIKKVIQSVNQNSLDSDLSYIIKKYELTVEELEKIYKLIKIKVKNTVRENDLPSIATKDLDKKYFTKFGKMLMDS